jgi:ankyrin repeat protein
MLASNKGHREMVELLLEKGASIDLQDDRRETALMLASKKKSQRHREVVEVLLAKGARRAGV